MTNQSEQRQAGTWVDEWNAELAALRDDPHVVILSRYLTAWDDETGDAEFDGAPTAAHQAAVVLRRLREAGEMVSHVATSIPNQEPGG